MGQENLEPRLAAEGEDARTDFEIDGALLVTTAVPANWLRVRGRAR